tara:strand:- start:4575 stop:5114 length:540 start_codon:yes stop_codon:yes gene_type:complete
MSDSESEGSTIYDEKREPPPVYDDKHIKVRKVRSDKGKKERTPAQVAATQKALTVLKERREAKNKADKERLEKASDAEKQRILADKYEEKKQRRAKLPPAPSYVTMGDLEMFKKDIISAFPKEVYKAVEIERKPKKEKEPPMPENRYPAPPPVAVPAPVVQQQQPLSGHALLDKMFFTR